jgi:uncharacterized protein YfeS
VIQIITLEEKNIDFTNLKKLGIEEVKTDLYLTSDSKSKKTRKRDSKLNLKDIDKKENTTKSNSVI